MKNEKRKKNFVRATAITIILLLSVTASAQPRGDSPQPAPPGQLVDIGGYRLHLNCVGRSGKGPAVVLIAGSGDFSFDWSLVQPGVSHYACVCSYDRAGLAWSDPGPTPRTMKQDAYELHTLLAVAGIKAPYVLVGHSIGGLIARVYGEQYPKEVAGMVLVDPTHEDTTLLYQGKLVRVRESAKGISIPPVQTMRSSPPRPPAKEDLDQFKFNQKMFGAPRIETPFDKLPASVQAARIYFLSQPPRAAAGPDFWAEELQAIYQARAKTPFPFGNIPLIVLIPKSEAGDPPPGISADEWKRVNEEKRQQKVELTSLSHNSKLVIAAKSGHHVQLDESQVVTDAIQLVVDAARHQAKLAP